MSRVPSHAVLAVALSSGALLAQDIAWKRRAVTPSIGHFQAAADPREMFSAMEAVCRAVVRDNPQLVLGYLVATLSGRFGGPREIDSGGYDAWRAAMERNRARMKDEAIVGLVVTRSGCRAQLKTPLGLEEKLVKLGSASDKLDDILLREVMWLWVFADFRGNTSGISRIFLRGPKGEASIEGMAADGVSFAGAQFVSRPDGCFGADIYFPWYHPFNRDQEACPLAEAELPPSRTCAVAGGVFRCR